MNTTNISTLEKISADSPRARAVRLKKVRKMLGLTTEELGNLIDCTRQTISYWENAADEDGGLSSKGALRLAKAAKEMGIICDASWLMYGVGERTQALQTAHDVETKPKTIETDHWRGAVKDLKSDLYFFKEIEFFLLNHNTTVVATIDDDSMGPFYEKGDWVGGYLVPINEQLDGKICIVEAEGKTLVGTVKYDSAQNTFDLTHAKTGSKLQNISIQNAALVTRLWKK